MAYRPRVGDPAFVPSPEIARAVAFAAEHHGVQTRKGTPIPYLQHLLGVASIAMEFGATEPETVAAILHDVLEDTPVDKSELQRAFGAEVTDIVVWCSAEAKTEADPVDSWKTRKKLYLDHLACASHPAVLVSLADKIHNSRAMVADHRRADEKQKFWDRFNASRDDQIWYYESLLEIYEQRVGADGSRISPTMVTELRTAVEAIIDSDG